MRASGPLCRGSLIAATVLALLAVASFAQQDANQDDRFASLLHRGFDFHQRAEFVEAIPLLRQAWKLDPHDYFVNLLLGIDLLRTQEPEEAIGFLQEARRLRPKEDFPYDYIGEAQSLLGQYAEAAESYLRAIAVSPDSPEAIEGWVDFSLERFRRLAGQLRSSQAGLAAEYRLQARSHAWNEPKCRELLEQSAALDPNAPGIWTDLALANLAAGKDEQAARNADRALLLDRSDLRAMQAQALLSAKANDWPHAAMLLNEIADRSPATLARGLPEWPSTLHPAVNTSRGPAAKFLACVSHAQDCSAKTLEAPTTVQNGTRSTAMLFEEQRWDRIASLREPPGGASHAWFQRGVAFAQLGRCDRAIPALEVGLSDRADFAYAGFLLSWCYAEEAGKVDDKIKSAGGDDAISHMIRGDVLLRMQGDTAGAIAEYRAALAIRGKDPKLLERLAEAQLAAGDLDEAADSARAALRIDERRYSARQTLARVAMEQGKYQEALPQLRQLAGDDPRDIGTKISLATALSQTGDFAGALAYLQPILASGYPDEKGNLHSLMGTLLRKAGQTGAANQAFAEARQLSETYQQSSHRDQEEPR